jgi:hypothetical protein
MKTVIIYLMFLEEFSMSIKSPCKRPECKDKDRMECADDCPELKAYQKYLDAEIHEDTAPPAINYSEFWRFLPDPKKKGNSSFSE